MNASCAFLAIGLAHWLLPLLNDITGKNLTFDLPFQPMFWLWFAMIVIGGSLLSGIYPAFVLSSFKPISMLGSNSAMHMGRMKLRRGLIMFQFLASLLLISGTYTVYKQTSFMKEPEPESKS